MVRGAQTFSHEPPMIIVRIDRQRVNRTHQMRRRCFSKVVINPISLDYVPSGGGGWSPQLTDRSPWLQVDLRARMEVTAVATQGRLGSHDWVSSYTLLYSDSGSVWKQYRNEDRVAVSLSLHHSIDIAQAGRTRAICAALDCETDSN